MSLTLDLPENPTPDAWSLGAIEDTPAASGAEGAAVYEQYVQVLTHWRRHEKNVFLRDSEPAEGDLDYDPLPMTNVGKLRVRFKQAQPMRPRRIDLEDDIE